MKKALETLVSFGKSVGRNIGNSIKKRAKLGLVGLALALPFIFVDKTRGADIEGYVSVDYCINGIGGATCGIDFIKGASYGWDDFDHAYYEIPSPDDAHVKAVGSIEGREARSIALPPLQDVTGSSGGASFSGSIVVKEGRSVTLDNAEHYLSASSTMPSDCKVYVNGVDLSETSRITLGTLSGTYGEGEHGTASWDISVEYVGTEGNGEEPNTPDPNIPEPNIPPLDAGPHILRIDNVHGKFNSTTFKLVYKQEAKEGIDGYDQEYTQFTGIPPPFIVSQVGDKFLTLDSRNIDSKTPVYLEQALFSDYIGPINTGGGDTNALVFSFPTDEGTNNKFGNRILTFQEYDVNEPNVPEPNAPKNFPDPNADTYPVYLIRELIEDGNGLGVVLLPDLARRVYAGTWHNFILKTDSPTRELAVGDFDRNGRVDVNDCNALEAAVGHTGNCVYDIASCDPNVPDPNDPNSPILYIGIRPDGVVDGTDVRAIYQLMDKDKERREAIAPVMRGDIYRKMDRDLIKAVKETYDKVVGE